MISSTTPTTSSGGASGIAISSSDVSEYSLTSGLLAGRSCTYANKNRTIDSFTNRNDGTWGIYFTDPLLGTQLPNPSVLTVEMSDGRTLTVNASYTLPFLE